jgi:hypothetical protein
MFTNSPFTRVYRFGSTGLRGAWWVVMAPGILLTLLALAISTRRRLPLPVLAKQSSIGLPKPMPLCVGSLATCAPRRCLSSR